VQKLVEQRRIRRNAGERRRAEFLELIAEHHAQQLALVARVDEQRAGTDAGPAAISRVVAARSLSRERPGAPLLRSARAVRACCVRAGRGSAPVRRRGGPTGDLSSRRKSESRSILSNYIFASAKELPCRNTAAFAFGFGLGYRGNALMDARKQSLSMCLRAATVWPQATMFDFDSASHNSACGAPIALIAASLRKCAASTRTGSIP